MDNDLGGQYPIEPQLAPETDYSQFGLEPAPADPQGAAPAPAPQVDDEKEELRRKLARLEALSPIADELEKNPSKIHDVRAALIGQPQSQQYAPSYPQQAQPQPQQPQVDPETAKQKLNEQFWQDPVGTMLKLQQANAQAQQQQILSQFQPIAQSANQVLIENLKANTRAQDPHYDKYGKYLDQMIAETPPQFLAQVQPQQLTQMFEQAKQMAKGRYADELLSRAQAAGGVQRQNPPLYAVGGGQPGFAPQGRRPSSQREAIEAQLIADMGLTEDDLRAVED